jgi:hypothetical protein
MSIKKSLAITLLIFFTSFGLKAVAVDHVPHVMSLLAVVQPGNYQSSVAVASRAEIIKLDPAQLVQVIAANPNGIFDSPYGFSLIHGWMLNQLADKRLPFYVNQHFSFDKYISNMIDVMLAAKREIYQVWLNARAAIEANRWEYYQQMQYIPAAIAQAGIMVPGAINVDVIKPAYVQALDPAGFNAHAESIVSGGALAGANEKTRMESIALWAIKRFDVKSLLPANYEINNVEKFKEHVVAGLHVQIPKILQHIGPEQMNLLVGFAAIHQRDPLAGGGLLPTAKNELEQYAVEQPMGDPTAGVPCLVAAVGA